MSEALRQPEQNPIDRQIEAWKNGPTILASTSTFRREQLENVGFRDVAFSEAIPESVEVNLAAEMEANGGASRTHWDSDGMNFAEHIAAAKVRHVLDNQSVDPETLVVSFDTTAVVYDDPTEDQYMGVPKSAEKYESIDDARADILARFKMLADGIAEQEQKLADVRRVQEMIGSTVEEAEMVLQVNRVGARRGNIHVTTGAAASFPHNHETISRFSEEVILFSDAIAQAEGEEQALEKLVDLIIETQGEEKTLSVSGGIDYADSYVRDILALKEVQPFEKVVEDEALYHGFAPKALQALMAIRAEELQRSPDAA